MGSTVRQDLALNDELVTSIKLIQTGLKELQHIDGANDFYHVFMLTLASGFERLMKVIICFHIVETTGTYPKKYPWRAYKKGHDLVFLLNFITEKCFSEEYLDKIPIARKDIEYLRNNQQLREYVMILSNFGQAARYYNLDIVEGNEPKTFSPDDEWAKLESSILQENPEWEKESLTNRSLAKTYNHINTEIIIRFERFARALSRLFTIGGLGDKAKRFSCAVHPFLMLSDDKLGNTIY